MYKNNLIVENKIIITTSDSLKIFAVVMPPYLTFRTAKVKIKLPSYFFPNSRGCSPSFFFAATFPEYRGIRSKKKKITDHQTTNSRFAANFLTCT